MPTNPVDRYNLIARLLHWTMAVLILVMIAVGAFMTDLGKEDPLRAQLFAMHKSVGVTILGLAVIRLLWKLVSRPPALPAGLQAWERLLAASTAGLLYLLMLATPIAGYLMTNTGGRAVSYFGLFDLPVLMAKNHDLHEALEEAHEILAFTILALVVLHVAGALKHRYFDMDPETDVLKRML